MAIIEVVDKNGQLKYEILDSKEITVYQETPEEHTYWGNWIRNNDGEGVFVKADNLLKVIDKLFKEEF